jgi:integrase
MYSALPVDLHDLRHSFVALALPHGVTLPEAAMLARHANARVTAITYAGVTEQGRESLTQDARCQVLCSLSRPNRPASNLFRP